MFLPFRFFGYLVNKVYTRLWDSLSRLRERHLIARGIVDGWLAFQWHTLMHQGAVAIALDVCIPALAIAPLRSPSVRVFGVMILRSAQVCHNMRCNGGACKVHEGIAKVATCSKVHGHVHKIKQASIARINKILNKFLLAEPSGEVAHHQGGPTIVDIVGASVLHHKPSMIPVVGVAYW